MNNSNELYKTFILSQLSMVRRGAIDTSQVSTAIKGYYTALADMDGADELTKQYKELAGLVLFGTPNQAKNARALLEGKLDLSNILDKA